MHSKGGDAFIECICSLCNRVAQQGIPRSWNVLHITSLFRKGDRADPANYRGLAVMSALPKLYATMLNSKLYD